MATDDTGSSDGGADEAPSVDARTKRRALQVEVFGELLLLCLVVAFFVYIVMSARHWRLPTILAPGIAVAIGTPFLLIRLVYVVRAAVTMQVKDVEPARLMDVGFRVGENPKAEARRFLRIFVAIGVLYAGIWLVGFHIMIPLWTFLYMYRYAGVRLLSSIVVALLFVALLVGVYDVVLNAWWHDPLLFRWIRG